jgi:hypothetical protein
MTSLGLALTAPVGVHLANGREPDVMSAGSPAIREPERDQLSFGILAFSSATSASVRMP